MNDHLRAVVVRQVVEVQFTRGAGIVGDPIRIVTAYFDFDGTKLAEYDQINEAKLREFEAQR